MHSEPSVSVTIVDGRLESISVTIGDDIQVFTLNKITKLLRRTDQGVEEHPYDDFEKAALLRYKQPPSPESFEEMERRAWENSLGWVDPRDLVSAANGS